ncbi:MAG: cytochrome c [Saprospiraceae bacterium]
MKKYAFFLLLAGLIYACGAEGGDGGSTENTTIAAADAPDGKKIWKQYCVTCHGLYGDMGTNGAYNLQTSELALAERKQVIVNGRGAMTPFGEILDEAEIAAVAKFTQTLKK